MFFYRSDLLRFQTQNYASPQELLLALQQDFIRKPNFLGTSETGIQGEIWDNYCELRYINAFERNSWSRVFCGEVTQTQEGLEFSGVFKENALVSLFGVLACGFLILWFGLLVSLLINRLLAGEPFMIVLVFMGFGLFVAAGMGLIVHIGHSVAEANQAMIMRYLEKKFIRVSD